MAPDRARLRVGTRFVQTARMGPTMYEVWISKGNGMTLGPRFRLLEDAQRFVDEHLGEASFAVKAPDHSWRVIAPRRRMARGTFRAPSR